MILLVTSIPGSQVPRVGIPHIDKLVHLVLYVVLGVLLARALAARRGDGPPRAPSRPGSATLALVTLGMAVFAAVDEWHQQWVPGRSGDVADWCVDVAGGTFALLLAARMAPRPESLP